MNSHNQAPVPDAANESFMHAARRNFLIGVTTVAAAFGVHALEPNKADASSASPNVTTLAGAHYQDIHFIDKSHLLSASERENIEKAVEIQSEEIHEAYKNTPVLKFTDNTKKGWSITLSPYSKKAFNDLGGHVGNHGVDSRGVPAGFVLAGSSTIPESDVIAHEAGEMTTNSKGKGVESFDPFEGQRAYIYIGKVAVSVPNFAFPSYFKKNGKAPYDEFHLATKPGKGTSTDPTAITSGSFKVRYYTDPNPLATSLSTANLSLSPTNTQQVQAKSKTASSTSH